MMNFRQIGETIICPHQDGDFTLKVIDLHLWSTGSCLITQEGQGDKYDISVTRDEARKLAAILLDFANGKYAPDR